MYRPLGVLLFMVFALPAQMPTDNRLQQIQEFLRQKGAPVEHLAEEFLRAADEHKLDWRLLPALAIIESAGGRVGKGNNLFGWGRVHFPSFSDSIHSVARALTEGRYRDKPLNEKLRIFNPASGFIDRVHRTMRQLGVAPPVDAKE